MKVTFYSLLMFFALSNQLSAGDSLSLYFFLLDDCVICQEYTPTINSLHDEYGDQVSFVGYFPNFSSKKEKIEVYKEKYKIAFPLYTDYFKMQAAKYEAEITPEVVLYNHTKEEIVYQGRIDNKFVKLGRRRNVVTSHELSDALQAATNNKQVVIAKTQAIGCYINYSDAISKYQLKNQ